MAVIAHSYTIACWYTFLLNKINTIPSRSNLKQYIMNAIKKITMVAVAFGFLFAVSSCNKHTCPTYSKAEVKKEVKA
jgi:hypothetical protein